MSRTTVVLTEELQELAKQYGVNVSETCREAVSAAVGAAKAARMFGDGFELVEAVQQRTGVADDEPTLDVDFYGRWVYASPVAQYYITPRGNVAMVDEDNRVHVFEDTNEIFDDVARQQVTLALGAVPERVRLDI